MSGLRLILSGDITVRVVENEETSLNFWRSAIFFHDDKRILEVSQDTSFQTKPTISFVWREPEIILAGAHIRTRYERKALVVAVKHANILARRWNAERAGKLAFEQQPAATVQP